MCKFITLFISTVLTLASIQAFADTPSVSMGVAEGYSVIFKNGINSGTVNTRLYGIVSQKVANRLSLGVLFGVLTDNTAFKPMPRVALLATVSITDKSGIVVAGMYQFNYDYGHGGLANTHSLSLGVGPTYKLSDQFSAALFVVVAKTLDDGPWSGTLQPAVTYRF